MNATITKGMRVIPKDDNPANPRRIGTVVGVYEGQYAARGKTFARVNWEYQRRYLTIHPGETRRGTMQMKALVPYTQE